MDERPFRFGSTIVRRTEYVLRHPWLSIIPPECPFKCTLSTHLLFLLRACRPNTSLHAWMQHMNAQKGTTAAPITSSALQASLHSYLTPFPNRKCLGLRSCAVLLTSIKDSQKGSQRQVSSTNYGVTPCKFWRCGNAVYSFILHVSWWWARARHAIGGGVCWLTCTSLLLCEYRRCILGFTCGC